jgi:hypothetical protein
MIDQEQVRLLYGEKNINFTLEQFESMAKDKLKLRKFRQSLKAMNYSLVMK